MFSALQSHQQNVVVDAVERGAEVEQRMQRDALLVGDDICQCHDARQRRLRQSRVDGVARCVLNSQLAHGDAGGFGKKN